MPCPLQFISSSTKGTRPRGANRWYGPICGAEAIRPGRLVRTLLGPQPPSEVVGLIALILLHDSRRDARSDTYGNLIALEEQDRNQWNRRQIAEALPLVEEALRGGLGPLAVEAAIAALHCEASAPGDTNQHFLTAVQRDLLASVERRGS
jgi:RNA polymerase sigma-70 factor (ECF subfamily)